MSFHTMGKYCLTSDKHWMHRMEKTRSLIESPYYIHIVFILACMYNILVHTCIVIQVSGLEYDIILNILHFSLGQHHCRLSPEEIQLPPVHNVQYESTWYQWIMVEESVGTRSVKATYIHTGTRVPHQIHLQSTYKPHKVSNITIPWAQWQVHV